MTYVVNFRGNNVLAATFWQCELKSDPDTLRKFSLPNETNHPVAALECCLSADVGRSDGVTHFALNQKQMKPGQQRRHHKQKTVCLCGRARDRESVCQRVCVIVCVNVCVCVCVCVCEQGDLFIILLLFLGPGASVCDNK